MKLGTHVIVAAAARFFAPLMALFALALFLGAPFGGGVGFVAGLAFGLVLMLHALTFGAAAARDAYPTPLARLSLALGIVATCTGAALPGFAYAGQVIEAGAFAATISTCALLLQVLFGRAPTLRDGEL